MRLRSTCALIVLFAAASLHAQARAPRPSAVEAEMNEARNTCREMGGTARFAAAGRDGESPFETRIDLNGDRVDDYILDYSGLSCDSSRDDFIDPGLCGSAGCPLAIFISGPSGHRPAPAGYVQGWELDRTANPPQLRLALHGSACGRVGADTCYQNWGWNGRAFAQVDGAGQRAPAGRAQREPAGSWRQATGANGYRIAMIRDLPPPVVGMAVTCERDLPVMMMNLGRGPGRTLTVGFSTPSGRAEISLMSVGATTGWAGPIRDGRVLDLLSGPDAEALVTVGGEPAGAIPLAGASRAIGEALSGCYRMAAASAPTGASDAPDSDWAPATAATGSLAGAEAFVDNLYRLMATDSHNVRDVYTPELAALDARWGDANARYNAVSGEEVGVPMDPLCDSLDCSGVRLVSRSLRPLSDGRVEALVRYDFPEFQSPTSVSSHKLILERTPAGWRIADIVTQEGSFAAGLRRDAAEMEGKSRRR